MSKATLNSTGKKFQLTDSLLRRLVTKENYESIKIIEPAIVATDKLTEKLMRKPGYKHTAISASYFYVINSPANQDSDLILALSLKHVRDVQLVYEKVDFLQGDLREHALHIKLLCCDKEVDSFEVPVYDTNSKISSPFLKIESYSSNLSDSSIVGTKKGRPLPKPVQGTEMLNASYTNVFQISPSSSKHNSPSFQDYSSLHSFSFQKKLTSSLSHSWNDIFKSEIYQEEKDLDGKKSKESLRLSSSFTQSMSSGFFKFSSSNNEDILVNSLDLEHASPMIPQKKASNVADKTYYVEILTVIKSSNLFNILRETWIQALFKATREMKSEEGNTTSSSKLHSNNSSDQILHKFSQLKDEVLQSSHDHELFISTKEMSFAYENYFYVKRAFWKMQNLIKFYMEKMKLLLHSNTLDADVRMDELDLLILIGDFMASVFQGSETFTSRNTFLNESSSFTKDLIECSLSEPTISPYIKTDLHELDALLFTWSNTQVSLLYELTNAANQFNWCFSEVVLFNTAFLVETLNRKHDQMRVFTSHVVQELKSLLSKKQLWSSGSTLHLYYCVYMLNFVYENMPEMKEYVKNFHQEEIKYYICKASNVDVLPQNFPLIWILAPLFKKLIGAS